MDKGMNKQYFIQYVELLNRRDEAKASNKALKFNSEIYQF